MDITYRSIGLLGLIIFSIDIMGVGNGTPNQSPKQQRGYSNCIANNKIGSGSRITLVNGSSPSSAVNNLETLTIINGVATPVDEGIISFNGKPVDLKNLKSYLKTDVKKYILSQLGKEYAIDIENNSRGIFPTDMVCEFKPGVKIKGHSDEFTELEVKIKSDDLSKVSTDIQTANNTLSIRTHYEDNNTMALVKYRLQVPEKVFIRSAKCALGKITVENIKGDIGNLSSTATGNENSIRLRKITGNVKKAATVFGNIYLNNIQGNVYAKTTHGNVAASDISGNVDIKSKFGNISLESIQGNITSNTVHGNIKHVLNKFQPSLKVKSRFGKCLVNGRSVGHSFELSGSGPQANHKTQYGNILIES